MNDLRKAAQQALKALESTHLFAAHEHYPRRRVADALDALKAALAQQAEPVQEPVAWLAPRNVDSYSRPDLGYETCSETDYGAFPVYTAPPQQQAEPVQEPVAWVDEAYIAWLAEHPGGIVTTRLVSQKSPERQMPLYTHPPRREWQSLTEEEIRATYGNDLKYRDGDYERFARAVEAALKEINND